MNWNGCSRQNDPYSPQPFFGGYRDWNGREKASVMFESHWLFRWVGLKGMPYLPSRAYRTLCREMDTVRGLPNDGQQSRKAHQTGEPRGPSPSGGHVGSPETFSI